MNRSCQCWRDCKGFGKMQNAEHSKLQSSSKVNKIWTPHIFSLAILDLRLVRWHILYYRDNFFEKYSGVSACVMKTRQNSNFLSIVFICLLISWWVLHGSCLKILPGCPLKTTFAFFNLLIIDLTSLSYV